MKIEFEGSFEHIKEEMQVFLKDNGTSFPTVGRHLHTANSDAEFFSWIYDRLLHEHAENPNVDYMLKFREILFGSAALPEATLMPKTLSNGTSEQERQTEPSGYNDDAGSRNRAKDVFGVSGGRLTNDIAEARGGIQELPFTMPAPVEKLSELYTTGEMPVAKCETQVTGPTIAPVGEVDDHGVEWDADLHSSSKAQNKDGSWKKRRNAKPKSPEPQETPDPSDCEVTPAQVVVLIGEKVASGATTNQDVMDTLAQYGATKIPDLEPYQLQDFNDYLEGLTDETASE